MAYNYMHDNGGAAVILGDNNTAQHNCLDHNAQYGFQVFGDTVDVSFNARAATMTWLGVAPSNGTRPVTIS